MRIRISTLVDPQTEELATGYKRLNKGIECDMKRK